MAAEISLTRLARINRLLRARPEQAIRVGKPMYRFRGALYVDHMLVDIRDLRIKLAELYGLQIALGSNDLPSCTPRHKSAVLDLINFARDFSDRSELDDLLLLVAGHTIWLRQINKALDCLEAVFIPRRIYRGKSKGAAAV